MRIFIYLAPFSIHFPFGSSLSCITTRRVCISNQLTAIQWFFLIIQWYFLVMKTIFDSLLLNAICLWDWTSECVSIVFDWRSIRYKFSPLLGHLFPFLDSSKFCINNCKITVDPNNILQNKNFMCAQLLVHIVESSQLLAQAQIVYLGTSPNLFNNTDFSL